jgi:8-oxo-dGTP pyrophosphatase MutT (NUDIX family)
MKAVPYKKASFPPHGEWDPRLTDIACPGLQPVELVHENRWFAVRNRGGYFTLEYHLPQVIVLPIVERRAVVMVRAKRPVLNDCTLELPAGCAEHGESPAGGGVRELAEETGIAVSAQRLVPMPPLAASPNRMPVLVYAFRVDLTQEEFDRRGGHDDEIHSVELIALDEAVRMIASGAIYVAIPVAMIGTYLLTHCTQPETK